MKARWDRLLAWARALPLSRVCLVVGVAGFVLDVLSCAYMAQWWQAKRLGEQVLTASLLAQGTSVADIGPEAALDFLQMAQLTFEGMLLALVLVNGAFYTAFAFRKGWAVRYVTGYLLTAAVFGITLLFEGFPVGGAWELVNLLGIPLYGLIGLVAWSRKSELIVQ